MPTYATTARNALRALLGTNLVSDVDAGFLALAEDVDSKMMSYSQGTLAARPAAGQPNRIYKATDTGQLFHDTGTVWELILGPGLGTTYSAQTGKAQGEFFEVSATRMAHVVLQLISATGGFVCTVYVGAERVICTVISNERGSVETDQRSVSFMVPPGIKWKWLGSGTISVNESHLLL